MLLIKAIRINNLNKLTYQDSKRFQRLIVDVFPGINVQDIVYQELYDVIKEIMEQQKLTISDQ